MNREVKKGVISGLRGIKFDGRARTRGERIVSRIAHGRSSFDLAGAQSGGIARATMMVVVTLMMVGTLLATRAQAYTCNVRAFVPVNVEDPSPHHHIQGHGEATCPGSSESKTMKVHLIRIVEIFPDIHVADLTQTGSLSSFHRAPKGCDVNNIIKGYFTEVDFTGVPNSNSGNQDLVCQT
jgi:hypothetical protein